MPLQFLTSLPHKIAQSLDRSRSERQNPSLPPELISGILHYTLLTPTPLFLLIGTGTIPKNNRRLAKPHLNDMALAKDFHSLCLVSKSFRAEARRVFFELNCWKLEVRLYVPYVKGTRGKMVWQMKVLLGLWWVLCKLSELTSRVERPPMILSTKVDAIAVLGEEALGLMKNVKMVVVRYADMRPCLDVLNETMAALKKGGKLVRLVVQFLPHQGRDKNTGCVQYSPYEMPYLMDFQGLDEEGSRKAGMSQWTYGHWKRMENVLGCMGKVGPVREVVVCGCVTDEYSFWLEGVIREGEKECEARVFDRVVEARKMRGLM